MSSDQNYAKFRDLTRAVLKDGKITEVGKRFLIEKAKDLKLSADDVRQALKETRIQLSLSKRQTAVECEYSIEAVIKKSKPKVVKVEMDGQDRGSGFFIHPKGVIVTNFHVVERNLMPDSLQDIGLPPNGSANVLHVCSIKPDVVLWNGQKYTANLIKKEPHVDLCFLKIFGTSDFPFFELGDVSKLNEGAQVVAIGHPLTFSFSATNGIISAKRSVNGVEFLQTTCDINPGNSGGPLIDLKGRAIGVNTFRIAGSEGLNFALPINYTFESAKSIVKALSDFEDTEENWATFALWESMFGDEVLAKISKSPTNPDLWVERALNLCMARRRTEAMECFDRAIALGEEGLGFFTAKVGGLLILKCYGEALSLADEALRSTGFHPTLLFHKASALSELGRKEQAMEVYDFIIRKVERETGNRPALAQDGELSALSANNARQLGEFGSYNSELATAYIGKPRVFIGTGKYLEAVFSLNEAGKIDPKQHLCWLIKAEALEKLGRIEGALYCLDKYLDHVNDEAARDFKKKLVERLGESP